MADVSVFSRLKRLFSSDVVIRNNGGDQLKVVDTDHIQTSGEYKTNSLIDRYSRIYSPNATSLYGQQLNVNYQYLRAQLYSDYDVMDTDAIIASALDIISDECSLKNEMGEVLQIRSSDEDIQKILYLKRHRISYIIFFVHLHLNYGFEVLHPFHFLMNIHLR